MRIKDLIEKLQQYDENSMLLFESIYNNRGLTMIITNIIDGETYDFEKNCKGKAVMVRMDLED